jgi:DNA-binding transcriptional ArsR family regulator
MNQATSQVATGLSTKLKVAGAAAAVSIAAVGASAMKFGMQGLRTADQMEQMKLGFETLLGSADKAQARIAELAKFAAETPFTLPGISKAARLLETFGLYSMKNLTMVGDAAAGVSVGIEEIAFWVGRAYSAIQSGRPFGESAMRLQELGLMSGTARNQMEEMAKEGASADEVFAALSTELGRFSGLMVKQSTTIGGLQSTLGDNFNLMLAALAMPFVSKYKAGLGAVIEAIDKNQATVVAAGAKMAGAFGLFLSLASKAAGIVTPLAGSLPAVALGFLAIGAAIVAVQIAAFIGMLMNLVTWLGAAVASEGLLATSTTLLGIAFGTLQGQLILFTGTIILADQVVSKLTGSGLIAWLTGAAREAQIAAKIQREYGDALEFVNQAIAEGMSDQEARRLGIQRTTEALLALMVAQEKEKTGLREAIWLYVQGTSAAGQHRDELEKLIEQYSKLGPPASFWELYDITKKYPQAAKALNAVLEEEEKRLRALHPDVEALRTDFVKLIRPLEITAEGLAEVGKSAKEVAEQIVGVDDVVKQLSDLVLPNFQNSLEELELKRKVNDLEALADSFGGVLPPERQRELDEYNARLGFIAARAEDVQLELQILGARFLQAFGPTAQTEFQKVLELFKLLPEETVVEILPQLDALSVQKVLTFVDYVMRLHIAIPIALGITKLNLPPEFLKLPFFGPIFEKIAQAVGQISLETAKAGIDVDKLTRQYVNFGSQASDAAGSAAEATEAVAEPLQALNDLFTNLASSVDVYTSALDRLLGLPTVESAQEDLEMARLKLRALDLEAQAEEEKLAREKRISDLQDRLNQIQGKGNTLLEEKLKKQITGEEKGKGPAERELDAINAQLDVLQRQGEQRRLLNDIRRAEATLANQNLLTDLQVEDTVNRIIQALPGLTTQQSDIISGALAWFGVNQNIIAQYAQMIIALGNIQQVQAIIGLPGVAAPATNVPASAAPTGPTGSGWSFVNGQWIYTPGYQFGGVVPGPVGRPVMAMVHGGERIVPSNQWSLPISVAIQGMDWIAIKSAVHSEVDNALDRARTQSFKSGAALSSGIG